ncbi:MAG: hypothetical protein VX974_18475, partial [Pseudomonadota bacterium]|nr:hypothetical protein [Pseudomonadota bacterium]
DVKERGDKKPTKAQITLRYSQLTSPEFLPNRTALRPSRPSQPHLSAAGEGSSTDRGEESQAENQKKSKKLHRPPDFLRIQWRAVRMLFCG